MAARTARPPGAAVIARLAGRAASARLLAVELPSWEGRHVARPGIYREPGGRRTGGHGHGLGHPRSARSRNHPASRRALGLDSASRGCRFPSEAARTWAGVSRNGTGRGTFAPAVSCVMGIYETGDTDVPLAPHGPCVQSTTVPAGCGGSRVRTYVYENERIRI